LPADGFGLATAFKGWTIDDILRHLHYWNMAAGLSLTDPDGFRRQLGQLQARNAAGVPLRTSESEALGGISGRTLAEAWLGFARELSALFADADPAQRLPWGGPSMSARSSISARLMETWAHAQAIYDVLGVVRRNHDRIRSIVVLGVNTYGWTFQNRGMQPPEPKPRVELIAPSGQLWTYNPEGEGLVAGAAEEFCQVVTQTRNVADTELVTEGDAARLWMENAQCFAGPPVPPPPPGARFTAPVSEIRHAAG